MPLGTTHKVYKRDDSFIKHRFHSVIDLKLIPSYLPHPGLLQAWAFLRMILYPEKLYATLSIR